MKYHQVRSFKEDSVIIKSGVILITICLTLFVGTAIGLGFMPY